MPKPRNRNETVYSISIYMDILNGLEFPWYSSSNYLLQTKQNELFQKRERDNFMMNTNISILDDNYFGRLFFPKKSSNPNKSYLYKDLYEDGTILDLRISDIYKLVCFVKVGQSIIKDENGNKLDLYFKSDLKIDNKSNIYIELFPLETYDFGNKDITFNSESSKCIEDLIEELKFYNIPLCNNDIPYQNSIRETIYSTGIEYRIY